MDFTFSASYTNEPVENHTAGIWITNYKPGKGGGVGGGQKAWIKQR